MSQNIGQLVAELNALVSKMETQRGVCVTVADDLDSLHDMLNAAMGKEQIRPLKMRRLGSWSGSGKAARGGWPYQYGMRCGQHVCRLALGVYGWRRARLRACRFLVRLRNCSGRSYWREKGREIQRKQLRAGGLCRWCWRCA